MDLFERTLLSLNQDRPKYLSEEKVKLYTNVVLF